MWLAVVLEHPGQPLPADEAGLPEACPGGEKLGVAGVTKAFVMWILQGF